MKRIILLSAIISIGFLSCKKEQVASTTKESVKPVKGTENASEKTIHCNPWRDVADIQAAVADLNALVFCNTATCSNEVVSNLTLTNKVITNSTGTGPLYFSFLTAGIDIATQTYMWNNAVSQAVAATPTGYTLSCVYNFRVEVVSPSGFNNMIVRFDIYYIKCGGSETHS